MTIALPRDLPPTYDGHLAQIQYRVALHGEWSDRDGRRRVVEEVKPLVVHQASPRRPDRAAVRKSFHMTRSRRLEVELDGRRMARGQELSGRLAVMGIAPSRVREVQGS